MNTRALVVALFILASVHPSVSQVRLEFTAQVEGSNDAQRMTAWAKGCEARIEDKGAREKMYMLLRDCGKSTIMVSLDDKAALKVPPMQSSPAPDISTGALFMQGTPQISIEKLEEKPGPSVLGRTITYYRFRAVHQPDPRITKEPVRLIVEEEFWTDATLNVPVLEGLLGKSPVGDGHEGERTALAVMKGLPLRHRTIVTIERAGSRQAQPSFVQEVVSISTEPFDDSLLEIPKDFPLTDMTNVQH